MKNTSVPSKSYIHYATVPSRKKIALEKRRATIQQKYTAEEISNIAANRTKLGYNKIAQQLEQTIIYDRDTFLEKLNLAGINRFMGKSGNRKMIKYDPSLYKSLIYYTDFLSEFANKNWFVLRLIVAANNLVLSDNMRCLCKTRTSFDPATQQFTKEFCNCCKIAPLSKKWFQHKYGNLWQSYFDAHYKNPEYLAAKQRTGRKSWFVRKGNAFNGCLCRGKNETVILDFIEKLNNINIQRGYPCDGYYLDGYCVENNTVYEVYEGYHQACKSQRDYDNRRKQEIIDKLHCSFVVIHDIDKELQLDKLQIEIQYAQA